MEKIEFIGQSPFDAHYAVFLGSAATSFRTDRFTVVKRQVKRFGDGASVELAIIGESHFAIVRNPAGVVKVVELLACVQVADLPVAPTKVHPIGLSMSGPWELQQHGVSFRTHVGVGEVREAGVKIGVLSAFALAVEFEHVFPGPCAPRTYVALHRDHLGRLYLSTVHEYVRSDSRIVPIVSNTLIVLEDK